MDFKDTSNPETKNSPQPKQRSAAFGQSLPRTAPVPTEQDAPLVSDVPALSEVPDWRAEDDIIREAAQRDEHIVVPPHLDPRPRPALEARSAAQSDSDALPASKTAAESGEAASKASKQNANVETSPAPPSSSTGSLQNQNSQSLDRPSETHPRHTLFTLGVYAVRMVGNLVVLMFPTLCVLLLSGWGPSEVAIVFNDFWPYIGLSALVTVILVVVDEIVQLVSARVKLKKPVEWMIEFVLAAIVAAVCLFFFTGSALGALLLGLVISIFTSLVSQLVEKLF